MVHRAIIPAGTYDNQDEDVVTISIVITLMVDESAEDTVYEMTKVLWENVDTLKTTHNALKSLSVENAVKDLAGLPLHDGAKKYYEEVGVL